MENEVLSVSELNAFVNQTLQFAYPLVVVEGEVSSYKVNQGKWVFFDLKDEESTISCFMPIFHLKVALEDGMKIRASSTPNLTKWGKFSLTVKGVELAGEGSVKKAFDLLKAKFELEGLFDPARKRAIPQYARRIALITSQQAAAYNDFITIAQDRWVGLEITQAQVQVQGADAPRQIVRAIDFFNAHVADYDVLVIIRGGGSAEDLQAFSHEDVVRAVYGAKLPTVVGIGHEDDVSLAELVADVRAATPTDAARRITADKAEVESQLAGTLEGMARSMQRSIERHDRTIERVQHSFARVYHDLNERVDRTHLRIGHRIDELVRRARQQVTLQSRNVSSLDPRAILSRGYSIATIDGKSVKSSDQITTRSLVMLQLHQGNVTMRRADGISNTQQTSIEL